MTARDIAPSTADVEPLRDVIATFISREVGHFHEGMLVQADELIEHLEAHGYAVITEADRQKLVGAWVMQAVR